MAERFPRDALYRARMALEGIVCLVAESRDTNIPPESLYWLLYPIAVDLQAAEQMLVARE